MKNRIFFLLSTLLFLSSGFSSPHNGKTGVDTSNDKIAATQIFEATNVVIPLQVIAPKVMQIHINSRFILQKNVNSTLYYRNFYAYLKSKPLLWKVVKMANCEIKFI